LEQEAVYAHELERFAAAYDLTRFGYGVTI